MKRIKWFMLLAICAVVLMGCGVNNWSREMNISGDQKPSIGAINHTNKAIKMDVIDELPDFNCIVVRFIDAGHTRYMVLSKSMMTGSKASVNFQPAVNLQVMSETSVTTKSGKSSRTTYEDDNITVIP